MKQRSSKNTWGFYHWAFVNESARAGGIKPTGSDMSVITVMFQCGHHHMPLCQASPNFNIMDIGETKLR